MPVFEATSAHLLSQLQGSRRESDRFFTVIKPECFYDRPIAERHRVIFYVAHLDGFDSIQICREGLGVPSFDPGLDKLFQAGIDPDSGHLPTDTPADWPSLPDVQRYVQRCREHVDRYLDRAPENIVLMSLEHRYMHLETLAYMFHNFPYGMKQQPASPPEILDEHPAKNEWLTIPAGRAYLGLRSDGQTFGWDNEFEAHSKKVEAFRIQRYSISNGDYLAFIRETDAALPHFWVQRGERLLYRGMFEEIDLPMNWPVYVTYDQAQSYARWLGAALPSEEQFHRAAYGTPDDQVRPYPWGSADPKTIDGNFDFRRWDPEPVNAHPETRSAFGVEQLVGNGWQWTSSAFAPFPGFKPRASYPGYSANFFDGEHMVMKGGSSRTAAPFLRSSFRNWFRHDYPYMYATFRCVENAK